MNPREKFLAVVLLGILLAVGGSALFGRYQRNIDRGEAALHSARQRLQSAKTTIAKGRQAMLQLQDWEELSLPPDRDVAQSLYRSWLSKTAESAGLRVEDIHPNERTTASTAYQAVSFSIEGKGTLDAVTTFLYEFYHRAMLHQITKLNLVATPGAAELTVSLQVEALILPGATHDDSLPDGQTDRLKLAGLDDYKSAIVGRNIFKSYTPPAPPRQAVARTVPRPPPEFDHASQAHVTSILGSPDRLQAWITIRTTGEVLRVHEGDDVEVGGLKGKVESISLSGLAVVIKMDDDRMLRVKLGQSLRDAEKSAEKAETQARSDS